MMTNPQRWRYGDWYLKAVAETKRKQRQQPQPPQPKDIFKYGISDPDKDVVNVYNRKNGRNLFEVESYDEGQRLLNEEYGTGA